MSHITKKILKNGSGCCLFGIQYKVRTTKHYWLAWSQYNVTGWAYDMLPQQSRTMKSALGPTATNSYIISGNVLTTVSVLLTYRPHSVLLQCLTSSSYRARRQVSLLRTSDPNSEPRFSNLRFQRSTWEGHEPDMETRAK